MKVYTAKTRIRIGDEFYNAGHQFSGEAVHPNILASIEMGQNIFDVTELPDTEEEGNVKEIDAEGEVDEKLDDLPEGDIPEASQTKDEEAAKQLKKPKKSNK